MVIGYETIKGRGKLLVPHEPVASIVREAFEGYASGRFETQAEVRRFLDSTPDFPRNNKGVITQQRVTDFLTHPIYTGYICSENYGLNWLKGQHKALISLKTYDKVQQRRKGTVKAPVRKNIGNDFALRGFVICVDCDVPLRSSWSKGEYKRYPYYLCQTKNYKSYGKSIPRDKLEGEFSEIIKSLQPEKSLFVMAKAMFKKAWDTRKVQAEGALKSGRLQIQNIENQVEALLGRIIDASSPTVIAAYETKINALEREKHKMREQIGKIVPPKDKFDEMLELSLQFLANPWKLCTSGNITMQRTVLRLAFVEPIAYCRNEGPRTPKRPYLSRC